MMGESEIYYSDHACWKCGKMFQLPRPVRGFYQNPITTLHAICPFCKNEYQGDWDEGEGCDMYFVWWEVST